MAYHVSFFFQVKQDRTAGWSENFWNDLVDASVVAARATELRTLLVLVHGNQSVCEEVRISATDAFRAVEPLKFNQTPEAPTNGSGDTDFVTTAASLVLTGPSKYKTRQWIKGIEDGDIRSGGKWDPTANSTTRWNKLFAALMAGSNGWKARVQDRTVAKKLITAVTQAGVMTVPGHGYITGDHVRVSRAKGTFDINHIWQVLVVDANTIQLIGFAAPTIPAVYLGGGTTQLQSKIYVTIQRAKVDRATKKNVGRPFGLFTGQRRARKK